MSSYITTEDEAQKKFDADDKVWRAPKFFTLAFVTLLICLSSIYLMSTTSGCSLQVVP
jgi:hypothetical protein